MQTKNELKNLINEVLAEPDKFIKLILTNPFLKINKYHKVVLIAQENTIYQIELYFGEQVIHENFTDQEQMKNRLLSLLDNGFKNCNIITLDKTYQVLINKKGHIKINIQIKNTIKRSVTHNKIKNRLIDISKPVPWLIELGIMDNKGKILQTKQKKFKQINRFLEMVQDIQEQLPKKVNIVDIGCGKSYLTFALYTYLVEQGYIVKMIGLDLKEDVIEHCSSLAKKLEFEGLEFYAGDVMEFDFNKEVVNLVVTLHACDTATDYALFNAIKWQSEVILSVPCCQHEVNKQIDPKSCEIMLNHGIIKERFSALLTDSIRGEILSSYGYNVQIMEFIEMQQTAKNLLIRAVRKKSKPKVINLDKCFEIMEQYKVKPKLYSLLEENELL